MAPTFLARFAVVTRRRVLWGEDEATGGGSSVWVAPTSIEKELLENQYAPHPLGWFHTCR